MNKDTLVDAYPLEWGGDKMGELEVWKTSKGIYYSTINGEKVKNSTSGTQGVSFQKGLRQFERDMKFDSRNF